MSRRDQDPLAVVVTAGLAVLAARRAATAEVAELVRYEERVPLREVIRGGRANGRPV